MAQTYKHEENQIDPRDRALVAYHPETKRFVVKHADLRIAGISPSTFHDGRHGYHYIWMWSEKLQTSILYSSDRPLRDAGLKIGDVFVPCPRPLKTAVELRAYDLSLGTELHILKD